MKVLYNVTVKVESDIQEEWLEWMKNVHIPDVMSTKLFESYKLNRILGDDDEHGVGFATQYLAKDMDDFENYQRDHAKRLQKDHADKFGQKYVAFRTLMMVESEG